MRIKRFNTKGMSLIEVMAAMLILAIGILGLAPLMVITMDGNSFSDELSKANILAQDKIETLRNSGTFINLPFVDIDNNVDNRFNLVTTINGAESDPSVPSGVYSVHVNVTWIDKNSLPRSVDYRTYTTR